MSSLSSKTGNHIIDSINQSNNMVQLKDLHPGIKSDHKIFSAQFPIGINTDKVISDYLKSGEIEYAEQDSKSNCTNGSVVIPNDPNFYLQWALNNNGTFPLSPSVDGADIDMERAWSVEQGDSSIVVAIISTGAKMDHPEFSGRIWTNKHETPGNGLDDDNNGYIDDVNGWDFVNNDNNPMDDQGTGTGITSVIGANSNNGNMLTGIDWHCKLMILKALASDGNGYWSYATSATYYATDNGAKVILLALGGTSYNSALNDAVNYALSHNVSVISTMGNTNSGTISYPGAFPGVIAVGATNPQDYRAKTLCWSSTNGSNYGNAISVVAPGDFISGLKYNSNETYYYYGGTAMGAAHVAGVASLLLAQVPTRTPAQIKSIIESTAEDQVGDPIEDTPGWDKYYGHGRLNAYFALTGYTPNKVIAPSNFSIEISPNPTTKKFNISVAQDMKNIQILNEMGNLVLNQDLDNQTHFETQINHAGIYLVRGRLENGRTITKKLIVTR